MSTRVRFPLRFKILVSLLSVITLVVGLITFTMGNLFHTDKTTYINDLTSVVVQHAAQETRALLDGYQGRLQVYRFLLEDEGLTDAARGKKISGLFRDFEELVAVTTYDSADNVASTIYDAHVLQGVGVERSDLERFRDQHPLPLEEIRRGAVHLESLTLSDELPCFAMTFAESGDSEDPTVISAVLRSDALMALAGRARLFDVYLVTSTGQVLAARNVDEVIDGTVPAPLLEGSRASSELTMGITREVMSGDQEMIAGFSNSGFSGVVACVQIPKASAYLASRTLLNKLMMVALLLLVASAIAGLFFAHRLTKPLEILSRAARRVGQGEFDVQVSVDSADEIGSLSGSFNQMATGLKVREESLAQAQAQLVQSEKMAAFGAMGAGIAHEVKNPLAGILGCAQLLIDDAEEGTQLEELLKLIEKETRRCKDIIDNLLRFARQEKAVQEPILVEDVIKDATAIVNHQLGMKRVSLATDVAEGLPRIRGNANQIQQVLMNLMMNAQQAMEETGGKVEVTARMRDDGPVEIRVEDNGPGIRPEHKEKLFEPFFTTKRGGKGTGLGLSVSYGIIQDHHGTIEVDTEVGRGTAFIITFPVLSSGSEAAAEGAGTAEAPHMTAVDGGTSAPQPGSPEPGSIDPDPDLPEWLDKAS